MTFEEILNQTMALLQRQGRVSYRALKRQFDLDEAYVEDLKLELIEVHQVAVDQANTMLVWTGGAAAPSHPTTHWRPGSYEGQGSAGDWRPRLPCIDPHSKRRLNVPVALRSESN